MFCSCKMATEVGLSLQRSINLCAPPSGIIKFHSTFQFSIVDVTSEMWTNENGISLTGEKVTRARNFMGNFLARNMFIGQNLLRARQETMRQTNLGHQDVNIEQVFRCCSSEALCCPF